MISRSQKHAYELMTLRLIFRKLSTQSGRDLGSKEFERGRVLVYDFKTGKRVWQTTIADPKRGESVPSAPIAWDGLVFVGNAGGDFKGGKGHMEAVGRGSSAKVPLFSSVERTSKAVRRFGRSNALARVAKAGADCCMSPISCDS
jgi:hypothetical protein